MQSPWAPRIEVVSIVTWPSRARGWTMSLCRSGVITVWLLSCGGADFRPNGSEKSVANITIEQPPSTRVRTTHGMGPHSRLGPAPTTCHRSSSGSSVKTAGLAIESLTLARWLTRGARLDVGCTNVPRAPNSFVADQFLFDTFRHI